MATSTTISVAAPKNPLTEANARLAEARDATEAPAPSKPMATKPEVKVLAPLTPIQILNERVSAAKAAADLELVKIRHTRSQFEKVGFTPPDGIGPAELARLQSEFENNKVALHGVEKNFRPTVFTMDFLDGMEDAKDLLSRALAYLRKKHSEVQKRQAGLPATGKRADESQHLFQAPDVLPPLPPPPLHKVPTGGLFGAPILPPFEEDFRILAREVELFPDHLTFTRIVEMVNALNSRLYQAAPPRPLAERCDVGFVPKHG